MLRPGLPNLFSLTRDPPADVVLPKLMPEQPQDADEAAALLVALVLLRANCTEDDVDPDRRPTSAAPLPARGERCTKPCESGGDARSAVVCAQRV